jgi:hypothetical protein
MISATYLYIAFLMGHCRRRGFARRRLQLVRLAILLRNRALKMMIIRPGSTRKNFVMKFFTIIVLMFFWLWMDGSRHLHGYLSFWWFSSVGPKTINHVCSLKSFVLGGRYDVTMILVSIYCDMASFLNDWIICGLIYFFIWLLLGVFDVQ